MIRSWLSVCGISSIEMRHYGFVPHSRHFRGEANYALKKSDALTVLESQGYATIIEIRGTSRLRESTKQLCDLIRDYEEKTLPWTAFISDRKRVPTVVFAFQNQNDAVRARLILECG